MKDSIRRKLEKLDERFEEISRLLSDPGVISRQNDFRELSMEYSRLRALGRALSLPSFHRARIRCAHRQGDVASDKDSELEMDEELREILRRAWRPKNSALQRLLVPKDPQDDSNIFLEVRAGTGGDEAAILRATCFACTPVMPSPRDGKWRF